MGKIDKPLLKKIDKILDEVFRKKLHFKRVFTYNISLVRKSLKSKAFVLQNDFNLFETDWNVLFDSWELTMNSFANKIDLFSPIPNREAENLMTDVKNKFPGIFSVELGRFSTV